MSENNETMLLENNVNDAISEMSNDGKTESLVFKNSFNALDDIDNESLVKIVNNLTKTLQHLRMENYVFYRFIKANEPDLIEGMDKILKSAAIMQDRSSFTSRKHTLTSQGSFKIFSSSHFGSSPSSLGFPTNLRVNISQRSDLVVKELEETQHNLEQTLRRHEIKKSNLQAEIEELTIRTPETLQSMKEFEQNVLIEGIDSQSGKISAEKFMRFMEDWLKDSQLIIDKLRLRTSALKVHYQKVSNQLAQKQLLGENLHAIDFEKLEIENKHLLVEIDEKNGLLLELKKMTGLANLSLNNARKIMRQQIEDMEQLKTSIKLKEKKTDKLDGEAKKISEQLNLIKEKYQNIRDKMDIYSVPDAIDYVKIKAELNSIKKNYKIWSRRKQIKDMALASCILEMKRLTGEKKINPSWFIMKPKYGGF